MTLQQFLNGNTVKEITKEIVLSERFKNENGELLKFKIRAMSQTAFEQARKKAEALGSMNIAEFNNAIIIENTIEPNFKDAHSIKLLKVKTAEEYLKKVLSAGEISVLARAIIELSGFRKNVNELAGEVKN